MITEDKRFIDIQGILAMSDVHPADCIKINDLIIELLKENQELKKQLEDAKNNYEKEKYIVDKQTRQLTDEYKNTKHQTNKVEELKNQQKEFIEYLENEKDRLARECSQIYEDSLGKTRLVNEDIFNEVDTILSKYKEIIGDDK